VPEGHTIHRLARDHAGWFAGREVRVSSPQGRFSAAATQLDGQRLVATDAYGKHLFHRYDDGRSVHVHLGLFGKVFHHALPARTAAPEPRDTVRYRVATAGRDDGHAIDLVGATACDLLTEPEVEAIVDRLGPDPIRDDADPERAWAALQRRSVGVGRALMDQSVLAGVGNVYRCEVLWACEVHPLAPVGLLPQSTCVELVRTSAEMLRANLHHSARITTTDTPGGLAVYGRNHQPCERCGGIIAVAQHGEPPRLLYW
jgi:endonuclease-8